jgi:hypothetical protein
MAGKYNHGVERCGIRPAEVPEMADTRPTDAIRHAKQAAGKLAEAEQRLNDTLAALHNRKPEAAKKIGKLLGSLGKRQAEVGEILRILEDDSAPGRRRAIPPARLTTGNNISTIDFVEKVRQVGEHVRRRGVAVPGRPDRNSPDAIPALAAELAPGLRAILGTAVEARLLTVVADFREGFGGRYRPALYGSVTRDVDELRQTLLIDPTMRVDRE